MSRRPVAFVGDTVTIISDTVALVSDAVSRIGGMVALIGDAVTLVSSDLGQVKRGAALGQVGLGSLQSPFGGLGAGLGLPHPNILHGQGGQPPPLRILHDLLSDHGQLVRGGSGTGAQLLEGRLGVDALGGGQDPFGCSIQTRLAKAWRSWVTSSSRVASSTRVVTSSAATVANSATAASSCPLQARGWLL